jgi:DNA-directed RNA polymerase subunit F
MPDAAAAPLQGTYSVLSADSFSLPEELGTVKYRCQGSGEKVLVHIQDAHCNFGAQKKISSIIGFLNKEYGIRNINLEGGAGEYDISFFSDIPDVSIRRKVAEEFMMKGQMNGAEYFSVMHPGRSTLWGIEEPYLYLRNLRVYRDSCELADDCRQKISLLEASLQTVKEKLYNEHLMQMDSVYSEYSSGEFSFRKYLRYLIDLSRDSGLNIKQYHNVFLMGNVMDEEDNIDFRKANVQREKLVDLLAERLSDRDLEAFLNITRDMNRKKISVHEYHDYLYKTAKRAGESTESFPELHKYIIYVSLYEAVDKLAVTEEMQKLDEDLRRLFSDNEEQMELVSLSRDLEMLKDLFNFSLTRREYEQLAEHPEKFGSDRFVRFIDQHGARDRMPQFMPKELEDLDEIRDKVTRFYTFSFERDNAFIENMRFDKGGGHSAIVVTGGFHSDNLMEICMREDITFISVMPAFKNKKDYESPYFEILSGKKVDGFEESIRSILYTIQVPSLFNVLSELAGAGPDVREILRIKALALESLYFEPGTARVIITDTGRHIVFYLDPMGDPRLEEMNAETFSERFEGVKEYQVIADGIELTPYNTLWALGRTAEENVISLPAGEGIREVLEKSEKLISGVPELMEALRDIDASEKVDITVKKGLFSALNSNRAIYLPDPSAITSNDPLRMVAAQLVHELVGGIYFDKGREYPTSHDLASEVQRIIEINADPVEARVRIANLLDGARLRDKPLWDMSDAELRETRNIDYASALSLLSPFRKRYKNIIKGLNESSKSYAPALYNDLLSAMDEEDRLSVMEESSALLGGFDIFMKAAEKGRTEAEARSWGVSMARALKNNAENFDKRNISINTAFLESLLEVAETPTALEGMLQIAGMLIRVADAAVVSKLFFDDLHSRKDIYTRKPYELINRTLTRGSTGENSIRLDDVKVELGKLSAQTASSKEFWNSVSESDESVNDLINALNRIGEAEGRIDLILTLIDLVENNKSSIFERERRMLSEDNLTYAQRKSAIRDFTEGYLKTAENSRLLGLMIGERIISDPPEPRDSIMINAIAAEKLGGQKGRIVTRRSGIIDISDGEFVAEDSKLFALVTEKKPGADKVTGKKMPVLDGGRTVAVKTAGWEDVKDIYGEDYRAASVRFDKGDLVPDSMILRDVNGNYQIVLIIKEGSELSDQLRSAGRKVRAIDRSIGALKGLNRNTNVLNMLGVSDEARLNLDDKKELIKLFESLSLSYFDTDKYMAEPGGEPTEIKDSDVMRFNYLMAYVVLFGLIDNSIEGTDDLDRGLKQVFTDIVNKNRKIFSDGDIPLPAFWENVSAKYMGSGAPIVFADTQPQKNPIIAERADASPSGFIGRLTAPSGEEVRDTGDMNVEVDKNGSVILLSVNDTLSGEKTADAEFVLRRKVSDENKFVMLSDLEKLTGEDITRNTLTKEETEAVKGLIEELANTDIYIYEKTPGLELYGFYHEGDLFLDESLFEDPLALLHELGEGLLDVSALVTEGNKDLNKHTLMRGAGKKTRKALQNMIDAGDPGTLSDAQKEPGMFIEMIAEYRGEPLPDPEKALIRYNFSQIDNRPGRVSDIGPEVYLFGLQDHMDPALNASFTNYMRVLTSSFTKGVHNIVVIPDEIDIMIGSRVASLSSMSRKGIAKMGPDLTIVTRRPDEDNIQQTLSRVYTEVLPSIDGKAIPKVFVDLVNKGEDYSRGVRSFVEQQGQGSNTVVVNERIEGMEEDDTLKLDLSKLVLVASVLLDDKRRTTDFGMRPEELFQIRKDIIETMISSGVLEADVITTRGYELQTALGVDSVIRDIFEGNIIMRITRINWNEITDWYEANREIMRSL